VFELCAHTKEVNLSFLPPGLFTLQYRINDKRYSEKIIKE